MEAYSPVPGVEKLGRRILQGQVVRYKVKAAVAIRKTNHI
jgi:hypothetical protein